MQGNKTKPFTFEGNQYIVRVVSTNDGYNVYVERDGSRVNSYSYRVDFDTEFFLRQKNDENVVDHLIITAQSDIENKTWEKHQETIKLLEKQ